MTWLQANLSLQLLVEERIGAVMRMRAQMAREYEDAAWAAATAGADGTG